LLIENLEIIQKGKQLLLKGTKEQKKRLFLGLGSNWEIIDRKLVYKPHFINNAVRKTKKLYSPENNKFEPSKKHFTFDEKMSVEEVGLVWSTLWKFIRNSMN
jgi:hypothetical protein